MRDTARLLTPAPASARRYPPISVRHGYIDAVGLYLVAFGPSACVAALSFARLLGARFPAGTKVIHSTAISIIGGCAWLLALTLATRAGLAKALVLSAVIVATTTQIRSAAIPGGIWCLVFIVVCVGLCLTLAQQRHIGMADLGVAPPWATSRAASRQAVEVFLFAFAGMSASTYAGHLLIQLFPHLPYGAGEQTRVDAATLPMLILASGIVEETVVVAGLVTALEAAKRPVWAIYTIGLAMRVSYHLYYGAAALPALIFGATNIALYRKTRRLTPLIAAHIAFDTVGSYAGQGIISMILGLGAATLALLTTLAAIKVLRRSAPLTRRLGPIRHRPNG